MKTKLLLFVVLTIGLKFSYAQIEVSHISSKNFKATGLSAFLNFSIPVAEVNYITLEGGVRYFKSNDEELALIPCLAGYRYTLNQSGSGLYVEPYAGYSFGYTTLQTHNQDGIYSDAKPGGPTAGAGFGYLFEPGGIVQLNIGLRYEHCFASYATNTFSFRISHAFTFGRRND
ncbi:outer membrane beta-barrel protein [Danxiaibacter flavus]|uniref:Outer membrane beta-barrel protein n=1 Tax=Danxiaibacter flavus TaxID=3049108 RepID=A0ABV3ZBK0_9BACT|nr:outer membrane beta-barrel protein [Chitinophagaceae bacterium DXS]